MFTSTSTRQAPFMTDRVGVRPILTSSRRSPSRVRALRFGSPKARIDRRRRGRFLELLTIAIGEGSGEGKIIDLDFADGATVRLEAEALRCLVEDFGEPWPTRWRPRHR